MAIEDAGQGFALHVTGLEEHTNPKLAWLVEQFKREYPHRYSKRWSGDVVTLWMLIPDSGIKNG